MYNKHIIPGIVSKKVNIDFAQIDDMQETLGEWHDKKLALIYFRSKLAAEDLQSLKRKKEDLERVIVTKANRFNQKAKA